MKGSKIYKFQTTFGVRPLSKYPCENLCKRYRDLLLSEPKRYLVQNCNFTPSRECSVPLRNVNSFRDVTFCVK